MHVHTVCLDSHQCCMEYTTQYGTLSYSSMVQIDAGTNNDTVVINHNNNNKSAAELSLNGPLFVRSFVVYCCIMSTQLHAVVL